MAQGLIAFGRVVGATGAHAAVVGTGLGTVPNPLCAAEATITPARTGAGAYTITLATALPLGEFLWEFGIEGGAANANINYSIAGAVATVATAVAAVATDENFWYKITRVSELDA